MNNERKGSGQGTLSPSQAKVSAIIITVCTQSGCVLSYSLSQSSEETREFGTTFLEDRTVQIYSINIPLTPHYIFIGATSRCDNGCCSAVLEVEVIITTENLISFHFSFHFLFRLNSCHR